MSQVRLDSHLSHADLRKRYPDQCFPGGVIQKRVRACTQLEPRFKLCLDPMLATHALLHPPSLLLQGQSYRTVCKTCLR